MPELPEVETVRRGLAPSMVGAKILSVETKRPDLRFPLPPRFAARLTGQAVLSLDRRAKYLLAALSSAEILVMHLGMTGRFLIQRPTGRVDEPGAYYDEIKRHTAHDHVIFHMSNGAVILYNDQRRFGFMDIVAQADIETCRHFRGMGLEPLDDAFDAASLAGLLAGKKAPLKATLLDQRVIAGLGNIYVCEALHRSGLSPWRLAGTLVTPQGRPRPSLLRLTAAIRAVMQDAIEAGGSTLRDYADPSGRQGGFQDRFLAYDRQGEPCLTPECAGHIRREVQAGRSTYYCPRCQK